MREKILGDMGQYKITEDARFFSRVRHGGRGGGVLGDEWTEKAPRFKKSDYTGAGYLVIAATLKRGGPTSHYLHRLVAESFIPNPGGKKQVNHIDGNRLNNHVSNLEWTTPSENIANAKQRGAFDGLHEFSGKIKQRDFIVIGMLIYLGYSNRAIASLFSVDPSVICVIRHGKGNKKIGHHIKNPLKRKVVGIKTISLDDLKLVDLLGGMIAQIME